MRKWGLLALGLAVLVGFFAWRAFRPPTPEPARVWCRLPAPQGPVPAVALTPGGEQVDGEWVPAEFVKSAPGTPADVPGLLLRSDLLPRKGRPKFVYSYQWVAQGLRIEHGGATWLLFRNRSLADEKAVLLAPDESPLAGTWRRAAGANSAETLDLGAGGVVTATPGARRGTWTRLGDDVLLRWTAGSEQQSLTLSPDGTTLAAADSRWTKAESAPPPR